MKVTQKDFITIWESSKSRAEVARRTGLTDQTVRRYAWKFRKNGVKLSKLEGERGATGTNWENLEQYRKEIVGLEGQ